MQRIACAAALASALSFHVMPAVARAEGFEAPAVGYGAFRYLPAGSAWTFAGDSGISGNGSGFTRGNPNAPEGVQVAFIQKAGSFGRSIPGWAEGSYKVYFRAAQRGNYQASRQDFRILLDGTYSIGTFTPTGTAYVAYATVDFLATSGTHTLSFQGLDTAGGDNTALVDDVVIVAAAVQPPCPPSPVLFGMTISAQRTQLANSGDCWPMGAWAADDCIYTSYSDGTGFGTVRHGMGQAKLVGLPPNVVGYNIPSPTGEDDGNGPQSLKASSMVAVGGITHMLARNFNPDGNWSTLASSSDYSRSWNWVTWSMPLGYPVFATFGKDYQGARDGYLYVYSPDSESAYVRADSMVLCRVPKASVRDLSTWQFYAGTVAGAPQWSPDVADRAAVLASPGRCYRPCVSYAPGLGRYLMATMVPDLHHLAVYDAPEPWGPWTTVYYTHDFAPNDSTFAPQLPAKWMGANGLSGQLAYSCASTTNNYRINMQAYNLTAR